MSRDEVAAAEARIDRYMLDYPKQETYLEKQMGKEKRKLYPVHAYMVDSQLLWRIMIKKRGLMDGFMVKLLEGMPTVVRVPSGWRKVANLLGRLW